MLWFLVLFLFFFSFPPAIQLMTYTFSEFLAEGKFFIVGICHCCWGSPSLQEQYKGAHSSWAWGHYLFPCFWMP